MSVAFGGARGHTGEPFNIASYALLTHMLGQQCGLEVDEFVWTGCDFHLYSNHPDQAPEQLPRAPGALQTLTILRDPGAIDGYGYGDFAIGGYVAQAHLTAPVAV